MQYDWLSWVLTGSYCSHHGDLEIHLAPRSGLQVFKLASAVSLFGDKQNACLFTMICFSL